MWFREHYKRWLRRGWWNLPQKYKWSKREICTVTCDTMFSSTFALYRHVKKYHMDEYNYKCKECGKGFMNQESFNNHANTHVQKDPKYPCDQCGKAINSRRALNKHKRMQHRVKVKLPCHFCREIFNERGNLQQHEMGHVQNPNRKEFSCDVCRLGGSITTRRSWNIRERIIDGPRWQVKMMEMMISHCFHHYYLLSWIDKPTALQLCSIIVCHCRASYSIVLCILLWLCSIIVWHCTALYRII